VLILANGFFAAAEMAFVTARTTKLRTLADQGDARATKVLEAREESSDFLAMIQIGTTLVATLASAVGGASVALLLAPILEPLFGIYAENIALGIIVLTITYVTLVVGELVPKQLAIQNAETIALNLIRPLNILQRIFWLPIKLLDVSIGAITRLMGEQEEVIEFETAEELAMAVQQAASDGVIDFGEKNMIDRVFDYAEASLADIMTPRPNIIAIQHNQTVDDARNLAVETGFSRFVVTEDELDHFLGYMHIKDLLTADNDKEVRAFIREIIILPETLKVPTAFNRLIRTDSHFAIVIDEFGSVAGLVTLEDMLEEIVGEIEDEYSLVEPAITQYGDAEWAVDGATSLLDLRNTVGIELPETGDFNTLAGYFLHVREAIPKTGDFLVYPPFKMTIEEMEGHRISRVRFVKHSAGSPS
ncbi:MAG: HlyC/CorC family transporter, partial [Sphaerospermopsis sp. SIO1G2]|nr:HlyC/CorC family transporter [Sphaerospermopsis sp. SIO1G2]